MSLVQRLIDVEFSLANGNFDGGGNSLTLSGLRVSARITVPGGSSMSQLDAAIYGLPLSTMNQLSTVGIDLDRIAKNTITVRAGDARSGMALVYKGTLTAAFVDAQAQPNVSFRVSGLAGLYEAVAPIAPTSVKGSGDVAKMMGGLAKQMGLQFENNGVQVKISNPYLSGSARQQVLTLAQHAGISHVIDKGTLAIWNPSQGRQGDAIMISPGTGMRGYPLFNQAAVIVQTLFDPNITFGGKMQVQSDLTPACGLWQIYMAQFELDSMVPHGRWFATLSGTRAKAAQIAGGE